VRIRTADPLDRTLWSSGVLSEVQNRTGDLGRRDLVETELDARQMSADMGKAQIVAPLATVRGEFLVGALWHNQHATTLQ
jgi:hypothetical protein